MMFDLDFFENFIITAGQILAYKRGFYSQDFFNKDIREEFYQIDIYETQTERHMKEILI